MCFRPSGVVRPVRCPKCGTFNSPNNKSCKKCGYKPEETQKDSADNSAKTSI
ncbi:hypothetical protein SPACI_038870 [Sporomusa acidovorans DSM 3132]|uniref:Zinc-ribbon domain-containing protein n=1 Tax=Sporomusa acidovorans (strain ATCC 49682 / DSM 3132 / Mol) TaxID=1123286 RepID=A0ABZ3J6T0_SPOA4|nr:hypothetical protein SPACI_21920 [Sporomusa acidovorans DSM 3132]SDF17493.1 hypothetical protein SAMN04488499_103611 [Sporomusa acidovorans]